VSQAGFGGYRISSGTKEHEKALTKALTEGVNLIDTSANYADGGSEELVGDVLEELIRFDRLARDAVVLVSKGGYIQGQNYGLSQARKRRGDPFTDLVPYGEGLEHCIHPEFLEDQLTRSLKRLNAGTLDVYLLHNPEYYLSWAARNEHPLSEARREYYRRIRLAFEHLETEVARGRIRGYGISSNTFPVPAEDPRFTCLKTVWETAASLSATHHFQVIQFPMNLLETGAVLEANQPGGGSVLQFAREKRLGVLINRPLNAIGGKRLIRLAEVPPRSPLGETEILGHITDLIQSEKKLETDVLPALDISPDLRQRVTAQTVSGEMLRQRWRHFGDLERWRQVVSAYFLPRIGGVFDFLRQQAVGNPSVDEWIHTHQAALQNALQAVSTVYEAAAAVQAEKIMRGVAASDPDWNEAIPLSRAAIRALRSTAGIHGVLVGMRRESYVADVLEELKQPIDRKARYSSWQALQTQMAAIDFDSGAA
jgi:aryl-alcohol dehydrogenase-like predicted oxidoreductase